MLGKWGIISEREARDTHRVNIGGSNEFVNVQSRAMTGFASSIVLNGDLGDKLDAEFTIGVWLAKVDRYYEWLVRRPVLYL